MTRTTMLACAFLGILDCAALGQEQQTADQSATIRVDINLIAVHAAVSDRSGHFVSGLGRQAFRVLVDGQERQVTLFQSDDAPVRQAFLWTTAPA